MVRQWQDISSPISCISSFPDLWNLDEHLNVKWMRISTSVILYWERLNCLLWGWGEVLNMHISILGLEWLALQQTVMRKREQSWTEKFLIYQSISAATLTLTLASYYILSVNKSVLIDLPRIIEDSSVILFPQSLALIFGQPLITRQSKTNKSAYNSTARHWVRKTEWHRWVNQDWIACCYISSEGCAESLHSWFSNCYHGSLICCQWVPLCWHGGVLWIATD